MRMVKVTVQRTFLSGCLKGMTIPFLYIEYEKAARPVGSTYRIMKPVAGGAYEDKVVSHEPTEVK